MSDVKNKITEMVNSLDNFVYQTTGERIHCDIDEMLDAYNVKIITRQSNGRFIFFKDGVGYDHDAKRLTRYAIDVYKLPNVKSFTIEFSWP